MQHQSFTFLQLEQLHDTSEVAALLPPCFALQLWQLLAPDFPDAVVALVDLAFLDFADLADSVDVADSVTFEDSVVPAARSSRSSG